ncbi:hypothetical protein HYC85_024849 [Camellia sinensis]|uniref:Transmembrane protein n=1 Tax=Camellia sinensis TaxID=4442 RepID=A0A7J7G9A2_CAMSI|nr:hypothetical protein HYC85_024849 [Camellia sinensis]
MSTSSRRGLSCFLNKTERFYAETVIFQYTKPTSTLVITIGFFSLVLSSLQLLPSILRNRLQILLLQTMISFPISSLKTPSPPPLITNSIPFNPPSLCSQELGFSVFFVCVCVKVFNVFF